jgi:gamma-glutamyl:cysteine ligase YbdK (ATP-grasp superfamily)
LASHDGSTPDFESYSKYQATARSLIAANTIQAVMQLCWGLRLSEGYPTFESRAWLVESERDITVIFYSKFCQKFLDILLYF